MHILIVGGAEKTRTRDRSEAILVSVTEDLQDGPECREDSAAPADPGLWTTVARLFAPSEEHDRRHGRIRFDALGIAF